MIKKIIIGLICSLFILQGFQVLSIETTNTNNDATLRIMNTQRSFSLPAIQQSQGYTTIAMDGASSYLMTAGNPELPVVTETFTFPWGTRIEDVEIDFSTNTIKHISTPIKPVRPPSYISTEFSQEVQEYSPNPQVYESASFYPSKNYDFRIGAGLIEGERKIIVTIYLYPVQYAPLEDIIYIQDQAEITITHSEPESQPLLIDSYDLLILTINEFESSLQPLVDEKEAHGIRTKLATLSDIPNQGIDIQEDIKYYIKDAIDTWGIDSVLLIGSGLRGNEKFPVRYAWVPSGSYERNFPSDLYYADVYDASYNLSTWDDDGDGKYAEFPDDNASVDLYPDVNLGRLPCNTTDEVDLMVHKIISYMNENQMTKRIVQMGGDTFPGDSEDINEGEYANQQVMMQLPGYTATQLWGSTGTLTRFNILFEILKGVDFVDFSGHGSYMSWATHLPGSDEIWLPKGLFYNGFVYVDTYWLVNYWHQPVVVLNACSCSKFSSFDSCLSWAFLKHPIGGAIGSYGASGIGYGSHGSTETDRLFGWMEVNLLKNLGQEKSLGEVWSTAINKYANTFSLVEVDYKTLYELCLIGDPSVVITDAD